MAEFSNNSTWPSQRKKSAAMTPRLQSYANQSLVELTDKLVKCSREEKGHSLSSRTRDILYVLKAHKLRHSSNAHAFDGRRGVEGLLALFSLCAEQEGRDRGLLIATLANLCALDRGCRSKVMSLGLTAVASTLAQTHCPATLCSLSRLIANLALDPHNISQLQEVGVVRELCHALFCQTASESACRLSMLRAVRLLASDASSREEMKTSEGLPGLIDCLKSPEEVVAESAVHALHVLLLDRDPDIIQALVANAGLHHVVRLCSSGSSDVARRAVEVLVSCAKVSEGRAGLNSAGGVECLLQQLGGVDTSSDLFSSITTALCASCRDVLGRQRMRDCGGLQRLIQMLSSPELASLHGDILSALVCYYFDENSLKFMVKRLGLLRALTYHLQLMTSSQAGPGEQEEDVMQERPEAEEEEEAERLEEESTGNADSDPHSSNNASPTLSGFDTTTSQDSSSPFPQPSPPQSREDPLSSRSPQSSPSPSPASPPSSSSPSSVSPSSTEEAQPLPKRQRLCSDIDFAQPMPANFLESLLSSPSPYQTPSRQPAAPLMHDLSPTLESHVVQLLSRVSHLRDCLSYLSSQELLQAMFACFLSSPSSLSVHIFKTLSRVFANPHCFQDVINCLIPSKLHHQIHLSSAPSSPPSLLLSEELDMLSPVHTLPSPTYLSLSHHSSNTIIPCSPAGLGHMCQELLTRLSRVGESPYGQGVLAHLLLTGEEKDKQASALAAPLLCRMPRVCQRLMLDYSGQALLTQLIASSPALRGSAADSLLVLASAARQAVLRKSHGPRLNTSDVTSPSMCANGPILGSQSPYSGIEHGQTCRYRDSDHYPFDYVVILHQNGIRTSQHGSGTEQPVRLPAHKKVLMEASEVFNGMLGGHFMESCTSEVLLKDVHPQAFRSVLHHMYGCGWLCEESIKHCTEDTSSDQPCDMGNFSDSTMAAVSSNFDLPSEHADVMHTLRCLATASQFLLSSLCSECERHAALFLSVATVVPLFLFSQLHGSCWLAEECVRYVVALPPSLQRRMCLLQLASSAEGDTALDMLQRLVTTQLHTH